MSRLASLLSLALLSLALGASVACAADLPAGAPVASLANPGFDDPTGDVTRPPGWGSQGSSYGSARVVAKDGASAGRALELAPGSAGSTGATSFMVYQVLDAARFRGKEVEFGARVASEGAGVNLVVWSPEGSGNDFDADVQRPSFSSRKATFQVPANASVLTFGVQVLGPAGGKAWVDDAFVRIAGEATPPSRPEVVPAGAAAVTGAATVRVDPGTPLRTLPADFFGMHIEWVEDANGLVKPGTGALRPDVLALLQPLGIPLFRFPGGINADFYDWRKGVGPSGQRGQIRNPFNQKMETVHFGSREFLDLLAATGAEGCITVNYGTGTPDDAAAWAQWFVSQGAPPKCWEVGNEIYLSGPTATGPNSKDIFKPGDQYARDFPRFKTAIEAVIPSAEVGAIAHLDTGAFPLADSGNPDWTEKMLSALTTRADFFALHNGYAPVILDDALDLSKENDRRRMYRAMFAGAMQTGENLEAVKREVAQRSPVNAGTPFAITEFGTLIGLSANTANHVAYVDHTRTQASALYVASLLDVYMGEPRVERTMYTNPIHRWYGNLILGDPAGLVTTPTYHLYLLYRNRFEPRLVQTHIASPTFSAEKLGLVRAQAGIPTLVGRAGRSADGRRLTLLLVNRSLDGTLQTEVDLGSFAPTRVTCEVLAATQLHAINGPAVSKTTVADAGVRPKSFPCENASKQTLALPAGSILSLVAE